MIDMQRASAEHQARMTTWIVQALDLAIHQARCAGLPKAAPSGEDQELDDMVACARNRVVQLVTIALGGNGYDQQ